MEIRNSHLNLMKFHSNAAVMLCARPAGEGLAGIAGQRARIHFNYDEVLEWNKMANNECDDK